jgi:hypothetical protein
VAVAYRWTWAKAIHTFFHPACISHEVRSTLFPEPHPMKTTRTRVLRRTFRVTGRGRTHRVYSWGEGLMTLPASPVQVDVLALRMQTQARTLFVQEIACPCLAQAQHPLTSHPKDNHRMDRGNLSRLLSEMAALRQRLQNRSGSRL